MSISRKKLIFFVVALFSLFGISLSIGLGLFLITPADKEGEEQVFVVEQGLPFEDVAGKLERRKIITNKNLLIFWARVRGYSREIKAGEYTLSSKLTPVKVLEKLRRGWVVTHPVTIPEGLTSEQIAELLAGKGLVNKVKFLSLTEDPSVVSRYGISGQSLEGYLYPDTYLFARGLAASAVIDVMVKRFWELVQPHRKRADEIGMKIEEIVILASIVEKETGRPDERPVIASVFLNRLKKGMRLESDPTVIYGLEEFDGNLKKRDLVRMTPYNTYLVKGLTPGPISNPGLESMKAVLYPAQTDYLYFVSKNDGTHHFSITFSEHSRAVEIYQKKRKRRPKG